MRRRIPFRYKFVLSLFLGLVPAVAAFLINGVSKPLEIRPASTAKARRSPLLDPFGAVVSVVAYAKDPADETYRLLPSRFGSEDAGGIELTADDGLVWDLGASDLSAETAGAALAPGLDWSTLTAPATPAAMGSLQAPERIAPAVIGPANGGINAGAGTDSPLAVVTLGAGASGSPGAAAASVPVPLVVPQAGGSMGVQQPPPAIGFVAGQASSLPGVPSTRAASAGAIMVSTPAMVVNLTAAGRSTVTAPASGTSGSGEPVAAVSNSVAATAAPDQSLAAASTSAPAGPGLAVLGELMRGSWVRSQESAPVLTPKDLVNLATALAAGTPVPEPATWAGLSIGLVAVAGLRARRRFQRRA